ncbi:MAG: ATP-binding protein [Bdellovibrionota bacterium]
MRSAFSGKLTQALQDIGLDSEENLSSLATACALAVAKPCCDGWGIQLSTHGSKTIAQLCRCVKKCATCLGHTSKLDSSGRSHSCVKHSPNKIVNMINSADIPARYKDANLKNFDNLSGNGEQAVREIQQWISGFSKKNDIKGLILGGPVGVGKTYLLASIAKALIIKEISVKFVDFFQLITEIKAGYSDRKSDLSLIAPLLDVDVLIIDELGKGRNNEFELTILDQLVMGRYNANKVIVASTNCSFVETASRYAVNVPLDQERSPHGYFAPENFGTLESRVGKRIYSRLAETTHLIELSGEDYRRKNC